MVEDTSISDYKLNLIKSLRFIIDNSLTYLPGCNIYNKISPLLDILEEADDNKWAFILDEPIELPIIHNEYFPTYCSSVLLGGKLTVSDNQYSEHNFYFSLIRNIVEESVAKKFDSCCEINQYSHRRIVRRFHFDVSEGIEEINEPKSHFHFGGIGHEVNTPGYADLHYCLDNPLDVPRMFYPPLDFIHLLDLIIRQFNTPLDKQFYEDPKWRKIIHINEDLMLRKYYDSIITYYKNKGDRTLFDHICNSEFTFM